MKKLKVSAVNYLNTKPFLYGIFKSGMNDFIDLELDFPSVCAEKLKKGKVDFGLVPVAVIPELKSPHLFSDYCIGSDGPVKTVVMFSDAPLKNIEKIILDFHSRTSVELLKLLIYKYWKINPVLVPSYPGYMDDIGDNTAALVIGDKSIPLMNKFKYSFDLGEEWKHQSGLPFVFAAWISNTQLDPEFVKKFNEALKCGIDLIPQLMYLLPPPHPGFDLQTYFTKNISYEFDEHKKKALSQFLSFLNASQPAPAGNAT